MLKRIEEAIGFASKELSDEKVTNILIQCEGSLNAAVRLKKWQDEISKPVEHNPIDSKRLKDIFHFQYPKMFGIVSPHIYFQENTEKIAAVLTSDDVCKAYGLDPEKGVMLYGGVGVGKTSIMKCYAAILKILNNPYYPTFKTINTLDMANDFSKQGAMTLARYSNLLNEGSVKNAGWFIDDVGNELDAVYYYANKSNVIEEVIQLIYNRKEMKGRVHASTNLNQEDLKNKYGDRVFSRMVELFNFITFPADAKDMRS